MGTAIAVTWQWLPQQPFSIVHVQEYVYQNSYSSVSLIIFNNVQFNFNKMEISNCLPFFEPCDGRDVIDLCSPQDIDKVNWAQESIFQQQ